MALDTIERIQDGVRRTLITFVDVHARALALRSPRQAASRLAAHTLSLAQTLFPGPFQIVLTDNGSEFMKDFATALAAQSMIH